MCVAAVCAVGILVGLVASIVLEDVSNTTLFLFPRVCGGCVCSGVSSGTRAVDCKLEDVSNTMLVSVALCVWQLCAQWRSSGTGGVDYVLEDGFNTMLFSVT